MITGVSLFAGVGGFDLAMQRVGIDVVASVEIDRHAQKVLQRHFPMTSLHSDIEQVTGEQLRADGFDPSDGIITGGFPCQDLSTAGARRGLAGERSGLFWQIVRLADELQPKWLILENVPGLLSSNGGRDMGIVIRSLEKRGYGVCWRVLDAQYFGVAQRRRRLFFVCCLADHRRPVEILFEPESGIRDSSPRRKAKQETPRSIETGTSSDVNQKIFTNASFGSFTEGVGTLRAKGGDLGGGSENLAIGFSHYQSVPNVSNHVSPTLGQESQAIVYAIDSLNSNSMKSSNPDSGCRTETKSRTIDTAALNPSANQGGMAIVMRQREGKDGGTYRKARRAQSVIDHETWVADEKTNTLNTFDLGDVRTTTAILNSSIVRRLTPVECERLQGFPDDWTAGQTDGHRYKQMGNAVAVPVVEWILRRLVK